MSAPEVERLYTVAEAAERLRVSKNYVYDRFRDGSLPRVELGTGRAKQRVAAPALQAFIDSRTYQSERSAACASS